MDAGDPVEQTLAGQAKVLMKKKRTPTNNRPREPRTAMEKAFCDHYLTTLDPVKAWRAAGYSAKQSREASAKLKLLAPYIERMKPKTELVVAQRLGLTAAQVLDEMTEMAFSDPMEYIVEAKELQPDGTEKCVKRRRDIATLTHAQRMSIGGITFTADGDVSYRLIEPEVRFGWLRALGQHLGLFHEKLIHETHLHAHQHTHMTFRDVPAETLEELQSKLIEAVGDEVARQIIGPSFDTENANAEAIPGHQVELARAQPGDAAGGGRKTRRHDLQRQP